MMRKLTDWLRARAAETSTHGGALLAIAAAVLQHYSGVTPELSWTGVAIGALLMILPEPKRG